MWTPKWYTLEWSKLDWTYQRETSPISNNYKIISLSTICLDHVEHDASVFRELTKNRLFVRQSNIVFNYFWYIYVSENVSYVLLD